MGLSRSALETVFTAEWQTALKSTPEKGMVATCSIFDPNSSSTTWVPGTGMVTSVTEWYAGKVRVQPLRSSNTTEGKKVQYFLASVPIDGPFTGDVHVGFTMSVSASPFNPDLTTYVYTCVEVGDSSNPVERTLVFLANHALSA